MFSFANNFILIVFFLSFVDDFSVSPYECVNPVRRAVRDASDVINGKQTHLIFEEVEAADMVHSPLLIQSTNWFCADNFTATGVDKFDGDRPINRFKSAENHVPTLVFLRNNLVRRPGTIQ